ncbi:MAG TPA: glycoside hydrolase family 31 protein [Cyclobacteriaceae bacterium]
MSQGITSRSLGDLISFVTHGSALQGDTTFGKFRVTAYSGSVVRIDATRDEFDDFSYAVTANPTEDTLAVRDNGDMLEISLPAFNVRISKYPVRFSFLTHDGRVINEDHPFGISWIGEQVTSYRRLQEGERFIGLGEKTGPLDKRGMGFQNWNTDSYGFALNADPLYCTTPFYIGIHSRLVYGIFFDNSHKSFFNFGASNNQFSSFSADSGTMRYYFMHDSGVGDILRDYTWLTGRIPLPPRWSIGYQQCRYSYYPDVEVLSVARTFREKDIPADAIVLDIHHMDEYKIFTWNKSHFRDPVRLIRELRDMGFQVVVICDPGIKVEPGYHAYDEGMREGVFLKYPDGSPYTGQVWPGWCHFPDFTNPRTREWWKRLFSVYTDLEVRGFWNDMNEIATWGNMIPENVEFSFEGNRDTMRKGRNVYGLMMARSTYEAARNQLNGKRPFNLTRAGYSGVQRYAAVWTGDNVAYDEHMLLGARMTSNMGLAGISFAGYDVGGFVGDAHAKLFARWVSIGSFAPFFRGHSMINSRDSEPWSYGEEVEQIARNYIRFRYQLMPYLYSVFYESSQTGMPVQRSLAIDYTFDHRVYDHRYHNEYLFGPYLLVCPIESSRDLARVFLPEGEWYYLYDGTRYEGNSEVAVDCPIARLPVFVKAGAILPMQPVMPNTAMTPDVLMIHLYKGKDATTFLYYTDDGETFDYLEGHYHRRAIAYVPEARTLTLGAVEGTYPSPVRTLRLALHGFDDIGDSIAVNGVPHELRQENLHFFGPLEKFDPFYDPAPVSGELVRVAELTYESGAMVIEL